MTERLMNIAQQPFDYQVLKCLLRDYRYPRNKISKWIRSGEIVALKSGLYVFSKRYNRPPSLKLVANLLYGPSYVSLDSALAHWGLIPGHVFNLSSVSTGRKKTFETEIGTFTYQHLKPAYYSMAYQLQQIEDDPYLIATPEKALCDKLYLAPRLKQSESLEQYLFEDLRIDYDRLRDLDTALVSEIAAASGSHNLKLLKEMLT